MQVTKFRKKALIRDNSVPVGQLAPVHVECDCGEHVEICASVNQCIGCDTFYSSLGFIIEGEA
jgi:hypothetical protein